VLKAQIPKSKTILTAATNEAEAVSASASVFSKEETQAPLRGLRRRDPPAPHCPSSQDRGGNAGHFYRQRTRALPVQRLQPPVENQLLPVFRRVGYKLSHIRRRLSIL